MRFSMILEMVDRFTAPGRRAKKSVGTLTASVRQMRGAMRSAEREVRSGARSVEHFERRARRIRRVALGRTLQDAARGARRLGRDLDRAVAKLRLTERASKAARRGLRGFGSRLISGARWAFAGGAAAGSYAAFDTLRTGGQFEQYQVMLEGIEGSAKAARNSMRWVQTFAEKTPFELDQVMEAFVALKAYGIDPANGSLMALGDGASGMSKPLMQAIEALADATTGEFERLKEFGIRARKEGERVTFSYRQNGKDIQREAAFTGAAIEEALKGIFSDRFGGGMERQSQTLFGIISNLKDKWARFQLYVADGGIFETVKGDLKTLLADIDEMTASGELKKWAKEISNGLEDAWSWGKKFVQETDWRAVGKGLASAVEALVAIVTWLGRAAKIANDIAKGDAVRIKRERTLPRNQSDPWTIFKFKRQKSSANDNDANRSARLDGNAARLSASPLRAAARQGLGVNGKIRLDVSTAPGLAARTRSVSSQGSAVPIEVNTGRTMRGAA